MKLECVPFLATKRQAEATSQNKLTISITSKDTRLSKHFPTNHRHLKSNGGHADFISIALAGKNL